VARLLHKLFIEFTKSRSRPSNENALVESKSGAIIRKHPGYLHSPQKWPILINDFYRDHFNPDSNDHRPCFFPVVITNPENRSLPIQLVIYRVYCSAFAGTRPKKVLQRKCRTIEAACQNLNIQF
jgi:hypothetical protein